MTEPAGPAPGHTRVTTLETWDLWLDGARSPSLNMAIDEALLRTAAGRGRPLLRFYDWDCAAVSIGCHQRRAAVDRPGLTLVRRPTGGGVVFHDGDLTYTVAIPAAHWLTGVDRDASYGHINRAVADGLGRAAMTASLTRQVIAAHIDRRTMVCFSHPTRYDVVSGGRKVAGLFRLIVPLMKVRLSYGYVFYVSVFLTRRATTPAISIDSFIILSIWSQNERVDFVSGGRRCL